MSEELRTWPRLEDPPEDVKCVESASGTVWVRMDDGYWKSRGWESGVTWSQVLRWGPVTEVKP